MKPPICEYCGKDFRNNIDEGGMVQFQLPAEDETVNQQFNKQKLAGHEEGVS